LYTINHTTISSFYIFLKSFTHAQIFSVTKFRFGSDGRAKTSTAREKEEYEVTVEGEKVKEWE
jgi:hypothetical protein